MPSFPTGTRSLAPASPLAVAASDFIEMLESHGSVLVSSAVSNERACVEWRFGDGDPKTPAIHSIFIRHAEAEAIVQEGEAHILAARGLC